VAWKPSQAGPERKPWGRLEGKAPPFKNNDLKADQEKLVDK